MEGALADLGLLDSPGYLFRDESSDFAGRQVFEYGHVDMDVLGQVGSGVHVKLVTV